MYTPTRRNTCPGRRIFSSLGEFHFQQGKTRMTKRIRLKGRINAQELWWVSEMLANDCENVAQLRRRRHDAGLVCIGKKRKRRMKIN